MTVKKSGKPDTLSGKVSWEIDRFFVLPRRLYVFAMAGALCAYTSHAKKDRYLSQGVPIPFLIPGRRLSTNAAEPPFYYIWVPASLSLNGFPLTHIRDLPKSLGIFTSKGKARTKLAFQVATVSGQTVVGEKFSSTRRKTGGSR